MSRSSLRATLALGLVVSAAVVLGPSPSGAAPCPTHLVIGVRGSDQPMDGPYGMGTTVGAYAQAAASFLPRGTTEVSSLSYAAAKVGPDYFDSMGHGFIHLRQAIRRRLGLCPLIGIGLIGYGQGAQVVNEALQGLTPAEMSSVRAVLLLADPRHDPAQSYALGTTLAGPPSPDGSLGGVLTPQGLPSSVVKRATSVCISGDLVCDAPGHGLDLMAEDLDSPFHDGYRACCTDVDLVRDLATTFAHRLTA